MEKIIAIILCMVLVCGFIAVPTMAKEDPTQAYFNERIQYYESYGVTDPQLFPDEEFFGKWDESSDDWEIEPAFDYEKYPDLQPIEEAAKAGDYAGAKVATLEYYQQRFQNDGYERTAKKSDRNYRLFGEMIMENLMIRPDFGLPVERLTLTSEPKWFTADIMSRFVSALTSSGETTFNIRIHDVKKDGYMAQFWTKESDHVPYVEMIVNGGKRTYYPVADNTIRAGQYFETSYSSEEYMYANESYTSINTDIPIDDYSRRACLLFDFSDVSADDTISSATLFVYGKMTEDDNPVRPEEVKDSMDVFVIDDRTNMVWKEEGHCWANEGFDICFSYDGEYGPTICTPTKISGQWSASMMHQYYVIQYMLDLYRGTGNEAYAYHAIRLTLNSILKLGNDFTQVTQYFMQLAVRQYTLVEHFYTFAKCKSITPEQFTMILKFAHMQNDFLVEGWSNTEEGNNIGNIATRGLLEGALTFREFKNYSKPATSLKNPAWPGSMQGGWLDVGIYRSIYKLRDTVLEDGASVEVPFGYVHTNLNAFYEPYSWAETLGLQDEIMGNISDEDKELLRKSAYYVINLQNPIGGTWQSGDDSLYTREVVRTIANIARFFIGKDDPLLEWSYSRGEDGAAPSDYTSYAYDSVVKATLRPNWTTNAVAMHIEADGGYKSHSHNDDLAINLMAYGTPLIVNTPKYLYNGDQKIIDWQTSTRAHSTIEINNTTQKGQLTGKGLTEEPFGEEFYWPSTKGEKGTLHPETRSFNNVYDYIRAETNGYVDNEYAGGTYQNWRDVLFIKPGYFIVTDYIDPENSDVNTYKQAWHMNIEMDFEVDETTKNVTTKSPSTANIVIAPVDGNNDITVTTHPGLYCPTGTNSPILAEYEYITYDKKKAGTVTYNTILYPTQAGEEKDITTEQLVLDIDDSKANAFNAIIRDKNSGVTQNIAYYTLFDETQKADRKFGYYRTDASLAFVEKTAESYSTLILRDGSKLSVDGGDVLVENSKPMKHFGSRVENLTLKIETQDESDLDLETLKVYCKDRITKATINGRMVYFERVGDYIRFTETGMGEEITTPGTSTPSTPGHSSTGGGGGGGDQGNEAPDTPDTPDAPVTGNEVFPDIENHWAKDYIEEAKAKNIVTGDEKGNFNPENSVTRAELIAMLMRAVGGENVSYDGTFSDVGENDWYAPVIAKALSLGIISEDTKFRPNDSVTREEMCKMIVNVYTILNGEIEPEAEINFADGEDISSWAEDFIKKAVSAGIMNGIDETTFSPKSGATRAQAATVICRMLAGREANN